MQSSVLLEACVDSVDAALAAVDAGADRIELCGAGDGGTTPSAGLIRACRAAVHAPMHVMIRTRSGDFHYARSELAVMVDDTRLALELGADGIVFGALTLEDEIDTDACTSIADAAGAAKLVFHRAFDRTRDATAAFDVLCALGFDAVLTSGHGKTALDGVDELRQLHQRGEALQTSAISPSVSRSHREMRRTSIMAGGSVRADNARAIVTGSGVRAVHARGLDAAVIRALRASLNSGGSGQKHRDALGNHT